jgi:hypothetical protein
MAYAKLLHVELIENKKGLHNESQGVRQTTKYLDQHYQQNGYRLL